MDATQPAPTDPDVGKRVFAVAAMDETTVYLFGRGTHQGMQPRPGSGPPWHPKDVAFVRETIEAARKDIEPGSLLYDLRDVPVTDEDVDRMLTRLSLNPKIELDSGEVVWGCECWWGPEEIFEAKVAGRTVVEVSVAEMREEAQVAEGRNFAGDLGKAES